MDQTTKCPTCGAEIQADAPAGLCPQCLLLAGLNGANNQAQNASRNPTTARANTFMPPAIEEISQLLPQFELIELLGQGGMGAVYKARHPKLDRLVAIKILPPEIESAPAFSERFSREAQTLARLSHPNIVSVYDYGESDGTCYIVMEYVDGTNLRELIVGGEITPEQALAIVPQICDALQFAHGEGVVHRDVKPENILIDRAGNVKIADFGLAKLLDHSQKQFLTHTHQVMGTPHYMAPEQLQGTRAVDHRADIYSLGVVFYELLTGELPIGRFEPPSQKVKVDVRLDEVVLRALENEPSRRYQKASDVHHDLDTLSELPAQAAPNPYGSLPKVPDQTKYELANKGLQPNGLPPRVSRKAIIGACWAPFFVAFLYMFLMVGDSTSSSRPAQQVTTIKSTDGGTTIIKTGPEDALELGPSGPTWPWAIVIFGVGALGITAPFGTTILGYLAVIDIRHSRGRLSGLGLAAFDVLLYPLLVVDILIGVIVVQATIFIYNQLALAGWNGVEGFTVPSWKTIFLITLPICIIVDIIIARKYWRMVKSN